MAEAAEGDSAYFQSYAHLQIHREMLQDKTRTLAYQRAIMEHPECFEGKVVLDVGCGTGILSIFAARAGARKVYAVDASDIALLATQIVRKNGLGDVITVLQQRMEDVELPEKVDVVVSEWMGYLLIYESMLRSVLVARDKWLKDDGHMFPRYANMYAAPYSDSKEYSSYVDYWDDVYGVDMGVLRPHATAWMTAEPYVEAVPPLAVRLAKPVRVMHIDAKTASFEDVENVNSGFEFAIDAAGEEGGVAQVQGMVVYFDVVFTGPEGGPSPDVTMTTAPALKDVDSDGVCKVTHWEQTSFFFHNVYQVKTGDKISGNLAIAPNESYHRSYDVAIEELTHTPAAESATAPVSQFWTFNGK